TEDDRANDEEERNSVVPANVFTEIDPGKSHKHTESDHLLNDFQLKCRELTIANAVRRYLKAIFQEGYKPARNNHGKERGVAVFQVPVPGDCHKDVRAHEKKDCCHRGAS